MRYTIDKSNWQKKVYLESEVYHMKTRKLRLLSALLALAMLLALLPTAAFAEDNIVVHGTCGARGSENDVTWKLDSDGTLTISGKGKIRDTHYGENVRWLWLYPDRIKKVIVGNGVTEIGGYDFYKCTNLTEVDLSNVQTLKNIGDNAFANCSSLSTVKLPMNGELESIDTNAFGFVEGVGSAPQIREIMIPASVKVIYGHVFNGCKQLENVEFAEDSNLETIYWNVFESTSLKKITIPASVTTIEFNAFARCEQLKSVTFAPGSQLKEVGTNAFVDCPNLVIYYNDEGVESALLEGNVTTADKIKPAKPTVTFDFDNGTEAENKQVENSEKVTPPTAPTKDGYIFAGWYTKDTSGNWAAKPFDFNTLITDDMTLYARWEKVPVDTYVVTVENGVAWVEADAETEAVAAGESICVPEGATVHVKADETAFDGMTFERWEVRKGNVKLENDHAAKTSFTMPEGEVQLEAMYQAAEANDSGWDAATVVTGAVIGTGTAILAYHIGMEVYAEQVLGKDVAVPRTRAEVALLAWQLAGSPVVNGKGEPLSEAAQAQRWAVESGLMQKDAQGNFNGTKKMSKWNALRTLEKAKQ